MAGGERDMSGGLLQVARSDGVATVTIDHPPTNLVDGAFITALVGLLEELEPDPDVRVAVFASADPDFFLMHGDVNSILAIPTRSYVPAVKPNAASAAFERLRTSRLVSIAVLDGAARGGGSEFVTALDLRYASPKAVLGQPEVPMGILPGAGGTARLPRLLGRSKALEVILTGRDVSAEEALDIGWVDGVVRSGAVLDHALMVARLIAAMPPQSIAAVKAVVEVSLGGIDDALVAETDAFGRLIAGRFHVRPMQRFLDAGGQTRSAEVTRMSELLDAMRER
jgi:enoyl-CoA hydratase/carnithine racemase